MAQDSSAKMAETPALTPGLKGIASASSFPI